MQLDVSSFRTTEFCLCSAGGGGTDEVRGLCWFELQRQPDPRGDLRPPRPPPAPLQLRLIPGVHVFVHVGYGYRYRLCVHADEEVLVHGSLHQQPDALRPEPNTSSPVRGLLVQGQPVQGHPVPVQGLAGPGPEFSRSLSRV